MPAQVKFLLWLFSFLLETLLFLLILLALAINVSDQTCCSFFRLAVDVSLAAITFGSNLVTRAGDTWATPATRSWHLLLYRASQ